MQRVSFPLTCLLLLAASVAGAVESESDAPLPADQAAMSMAVPDGFRVTTFAAEPAVKQPIGFCIDDRARLWVAEAYNYPNHGEEAGDRIVILEDTDGDGTHDLRKVFYDKLNYVTGIEVGFGGVWVMSPPYFYFIPDQDRDDIPDAEPEVLLDGFGNHANAHNLANGFAWGPDGWLYGTHGRTNWSMIGKPGTPEAERERFDGGVYRYHPVRRVWEPYADGTTNPWGIDWNDYGDAFMCNCVNPHLFQVIQGAHYEPWRNRKSSQFAYERIDTIADHLHFVGLQHVRDGLGSQAEDHAGGGHAHCGTMVYLGDNWPREYRNSIYMNNIHGRRINRDIPHRKGSGYVASHGNDVMRSADPWFMGVTLQYGPDGGVFVSDWSDTGECHTVRNTRRHTGRIYKIRYGDPDPVEVDIFAATTEQLVAWQLHDNDWFVRHSRRVLQERQAAGQDMQLVNDRLREMFRTQSKVPQKLRALWALYVLGGADNEFLVQQLDHAVPYIRAWSVRLLCEAREPGANALEAFQRIAKHGTSPYVRLYMTSGIMRLDNEAKWKVLAELLSHAEDNSDANLPHMYWYAALPLFDESPDRFVGLLKNNQISLVHRHIARRVASEPNRTAELDRVARWLVTSAESATRAAPANMVARREVLAGLLKGLEGRRQVDMPKSWPAAFKHLRSMDDRETLESTIQLALKFADPSAILHLETTVNNLDEDVQRRRVALHALISQRLPRSASMLLKLLDDEPLQQDAIRGLASFDSSATPTALLKRYPTLSPMARQDVLQTLVSRKNWAAAMLSAVESGTIPRADCSAYTARQLRNLNDVKITKQVAALWGNVQPTSADLQLKIETTKKQLIAESDRIGDLAAGKAIFQKSCANCHRIFDSGGKIGPDLTGAQRRNLDYLLENMIAPSSAVSRDYQMEIITTDSGRILNGLVVAETPLTITVQMINDRTVIPLDEIDDRQKSKVSMMPAGLLDDMSSEQILNLIRFLSQ